MSGGANTGSNLLRLHVNPQFNFFTENKYKNGISTDYNLNGDRDGISDAKLSLSQYFEDKNKTGLSLNACYSRSSKISINSIKITEFIIENGIGSYFFDNTAQENGKISDFNINFTRGIGEIKIGISSLITTNNILNTNTESDLIYEGRDEILGTFYTLGYTSKNITHTVYKYGVSYDLGKIDSNTTAIGNRIDLSSWNIFLKRKYNNNVQSTLSYRRGDIDYSESVQLFSVDAADSSFYKIGLFLNLGENINLGYSQYKYSNLATSNTKIRTIFAGFDIKGLNLELKSQDLSNITDTMNKDILSLSSTFSL